MKTLVTNTLKPFVRRAGINNSIWLQGHLMSFLASGDDTAGQFALAETLLMPGDEPPLHTHAIDDEAFYILEGAIAFRIGNETTLARAGEFVMLPKGIEHTFRVVGGAARALLLSAPACLEVAFKTLGVPATRMALRTDAPPVDREAYTRAFNEQGIAFRSPDEPRLPAKPNPSLIIRPAVGRSRFYSGGLFTELAGMEDTEGRFAIVEMTGRRNQGPPSHVHTREDEAFYILEGEATVHCGKESFEMGPGDFVFLPRGVAHRPEVTSETARALIIITPAGFERYFTEHSTPATSLELPNHTETPGLNAEMMQRAADKYGFKLTA